MELLTPAGRPKSSRPQKPARPTKIIAGRCAAGFGRFWPAGTEKTQYKPLTKSGRPAAGRKKDQTSRPAAGPAVIKPADKTGRPRQTQKPAGRTPAQYGRPKTRPAEPASRPRIQKTRPAARPAGWPEFHSSCITNLKLLEVDKHDLGIKAYTN